jgi:integrase
MLPMVEGALRAQFEAVSGPYVFPGRHGGPLYQESVRINVWNPALERAGLTHRNPYQTRHTFASLMLANGEEPAWVARMMGHATTKMLYEHYYRFIQHRTRQDGDRFTQAFQAASTPDHP